MTDRAVSETVGFVFVFALVTASIGVVYTTGIGGLEDAREDEQLTNAVRSFDVLADNVADLRREGAPSRATELQLSGASLGFADPVRIEIRVNDTAPDSDANATYGRNLRPLVYDAPAGEAVFAAGATFRADGGSAAMRREPGWIVDDRRSVVPLLVTYPRGNSTGVGGSSTVLAVAHRQRPNPPGRFEASPGSAANVTVTVESPRAAAWGRYFESRGMTPSGPSTDAANASDGVVSYHFETERLFVPETVVEFEITN